MKITLSEDDLLFYGLELSSLSYSNTQTRRAFWALLDDAKNATGFDAAAARVSVQIYASREGGCEMYIQAQLDAEQASETPHSTSIPMESGLTVCSPISKAFSSAIGTFERMGDLLSACLALRQSGYQGDSSAWQIGERYYLCLSGNQPDTDKRKRSKNGIDATGVLWEFAVAAEKITPYYLVEHGTSLCPNDAVETLSRAAI